MSKIVPAGDATPKMSVWIEDRPASKRGDEVIVKGSYNGQTFKICLISEQGIKKFRDLPSDIPMALNGRNRPVVLEGSLDQPDN